MRRTLWELPLPRETTSISLLIVYNTTASWRQRFQTMRSCWHYWTYFPCGRLSERYEEKACTHIQADAIDCCFYLGISPRNEFLKPNVCPLHLVGEKARQIARISGKVTPARNPCCYPNAGNSGPSCCCCCLSSNLSRPVGLAI